MLRLPNFCSIYTAEAIAISFALDLIKTNLIHKAVILSDSLSTLRSIENIYNLNEISRKIQNQIYNLTHTSYSITLLWIPSHNKIQGNERADQKAHQAITSTDALRLNHFTLHDAKFITRIISNNIWLRAWKQGTSKLNEIKNTIHTWLSPPDFSRKMEISINRIRIGHTSLTHQYLMKKEDPPLCASCGKAVPFVELTVAHASVLTILAISFERYYAICEPLRAGYVCTKTRAMIICLLAWGLAALFTRNSTPTRVKMGEKVLVFSDFCYGYFVLFLMSNNDQVKLRRKSD
ncbi:hypothetical protein QTP88_003096 [Uroleucon formosanum]